MQLFVDSICRMHDDRADDVGSLTFDKDDVLAMHFVTAAANLRAMCYAIDPSSVFEIKGVPLEDHIPTFYVLFGQAWRETSFTRLQPPMLWLLA